MARELGIGKGLALSRGDSCWAWGISIPLETMSYTVHVAQVGTEHAPLSYANNEHGKDNEAPMVGDMGAQQYADNLSFFPRAGISTPEKTIWQIHGTAQ